jgi:hypothetical protein
MKCVLTCLRNTSMLVDTTLTCANLTTLSWNERSFQNELAKFKDVAIRMTGVMSVLEFIKRDVFTQKMCAYVFAKHQHVGLHDTTCALLTTVILE